VHDCVPAGKESKRGDRGGVPGSSAGGRRGPVVPGIFPGGTSVVSTAATRVCLARTDRAPGCRIRRGEGESAEGKALASGRRWAPLPLRLWACIFHGADRRCASVEWWEMLCYASLNENVIDIVVSVEYHSNNTSLTFQNIFFLFILLVNISKFNVHDILVTLSLKLILLLINVVWNI